MFREGQAIFFLAILRFLADLRICFVKELLCWFQILLVIFGGVIASQTSGKLENQQNQINPSVPQLHNQSQIKSI